MEFIKKNNVVVIGVGRLGSALLMESEFTKESFNIIGVFDNDPNKIGKELGHGIIIKNITELPYYIIKAEEKVDIAIMTVPKHVAQETADFIVKSGVKAILNFAPLKLDLPSDVVVENIDLYAKLQELNYWKEKIKK